GSLGWRTRSPPNRRGRSLKKLGAKRRLSWRRRQRSGRRDRGRESGWRRLRMEKSYLMARMPIIKTRRRTKRRNSVVARKVPALERVLPWTGMTGTSWRGKKGWRRSSSVPLRLGREVQRGLWLEISTTSKTQSRHGE
ncbi:hypothetical protein M407DRAFT_194901, partial [Tulasnella calospora MUT 4182]